ncbi:MAG: CvpA family protein [Daejeonella sp.]
MNYIDILIISLICLSIYIGYRKGFIFSLTELVSWISCLLLGFLIYPFIANLVVKIFDKESYWTVPISFLIAIILSRIGLAILFDGMLRKIPKSYHEEPLNKVFGIIPGLINGLIYAAFISIFLSGIPLGNTLAEQSQNSVVAYQLTNQTKWIENEIKPYFSKILNQPAGLLTIHPETNKLIKLPFKVADSKPRPDLEAEMLVMINQERAKENLNPLKADSELRIVARLHSADMFNRGYFSHYTPEGKDPFDRIKKAGISFMSAGENLALSPDLKIAHNGLMESPGHKANILHKDYGRVGIGILDGGKYGIMVTQNFRD